MRYKELKKYFEDNPKLQYDNKGSTGPLWFTVYPVNGWVVLTPRAPCYCLLLDIEGHFEHMQPGFDKDEFDVFVYDGQDRWDFDIKYHVHPESSTKYLCFTKN